MNTQARSLYALILRHHMIAIFKRHLRSVLEPTVPVGNVLAFHILALVIVSGCTVGPHYHVPAPATSVLFHHIATNGVTSMGTNVFSPETTAWWGVFHDSTLTALVHEAAETNLDLRIASARILEIRALRLGVRAGLFPGVNANGSYTRSRPSENTVGGRNLKAFHIPLETDNYSAGFDMNWEVDLFGGTRRSLEAATADAAASVEAQREVLVSVLAEVGLSYLDLRGYQRQLQVSRENLKAQEQTHQLTRDRFKAGLTSELDAARSEAQVAMTRSQMPPLEEGVERAIHRLSVLIGHPPASLHARLDPLTTIPASPLEIPVGLPSDLLKRRPDIRRAERELAAASARIGVAKSDLFPRFFLTGAVGLQSLDSADFLNAGSRSWSLGPSLKWPIFSAGRIRQNIQVQKARELQAALRYEEVVLKSLEEVENALVSFGKEQERHRALNDAERATRRAASLATEQHRAGLVDFLTVLEAERSLLATQEEQARSERSLGQDLIRVYKALGGGWSETP